MVNSEDGGPLGTATLVSSDDESARLVTAAHVLEAGACVIFAPALPCVPIDEVSNIEGAPALRTLTVRPEAAVAVPTVVAAGVGDTVVWFTGRSGLADWRRPTQAARIDATVPNGLIIVHDALGKLDVGAPVEDAAGALIGVIAQVDPDAGAARVALLSPLAGSHPHLSAADAITADDAGKQGRAALPPEIVRETMSMRYLAAYFTGNFLAFGDAGDDGIWPPGFQTKALFRILSLDAVASGADVSAIEEVVSVEALTPSGEATFSINGTGTITSQLFAACVTHPVPSAPTRNVVSLTFWQLDPIVNYGTSQAERIGRDLSGWADASDEPCRAMLAARENEWIVAVRTGGGTPPEPTIAGTEGHGGPTTEPTSIPNPPPTAPLPPASSKWKAEILEVAEDSYGPGGVAYTNDDLGDSHLAIHCEAASDRVTVDFGGPLATSTLGTEGEELAMVFSIGSNRFERLAMAYNAMDDGWTGTTTRDSPLLQTLVVGERVEIRAPWGERVATFSLAGSAAAFATMIEGCG